MRFAWIPLIFLTCRPSHADVPSPVLVELYSSEGCSSCPPADDVLRALDEKGRVAGVPVIALELHVDYWNDLGWSDPFSKSEFSARQRAYGKGNYTPQAIVDGDVDLIGSRQSALEEAIARAGSKPHVKIDLARDGENVVVRVPSVSVSEDTADVFVATLERDLVTSVPRGENAGRTLHHGPIVRELRNLGVASGSFEARTKTKSSCAAFVQLRKSHRVIGSAMIR